MHKILFFLSLSLIPLLGFAENLTYLDDVSGEIKLARKEKLEDQQGRTILNAGDQIATGKNAKATIVYANGTKIRVFEGSNVKVEFTKGVLGAKLKRGSIWANIPKKSKRGKRFSIRTSHAVIGIKGTSLSVATSKDHGMSVGLFEGLITIKNGENATRLSPGQMVMNVQSSGGIKDKVMSLPFKLKLTPSKTQVNLSHETSLLLGINLISVNGAELPLSNEVYLTLNIEDVTFVKQIDLDKNGSATTKLTFTNPKPRRNTLIIHAVMEDNWQVASGVAQVDLIGNNQKTEVEGLRKITP